MSSRPLDMRMALLFLAAGVSLAATGCARSSVHAASPAPAPLAADAAMARPMSTAPDTYAAPPVEPLPPPPVIPEPEVSAEALLPAAKPPALRKPAGGPPSAEAVSEAARPPAPLISPELSPGARATYQRKTAEDTRVAEENLQEAGGKQLNAIQQDLVEKIRGFLAQSREASQDGDWARAQNLAQKARLLSAELIASF